MCRETKQISHIMYIYAAILFLLLLITIGLAFSVLILYPNISIKEIVPHVINNLLPNGIRGLAIAGVMAAIMSTLDSNLNSASILFSHNVLARGKLESLKMLKINTLILGIIQMTIALLNLDIVNVVVFIQSILAVGIGLPLFFGIMGIKAKPIDFLVCLIFAILGFLISALYFREVNYISSFSTILFGVISFPISIYLNSNNSKHNKKRNTGIIKATFKSIIEAMIGVIKRIQNIFNIIKYSNESIRQYGANYTMFAIFSCINYIVPYFMWPHQISHSYTILLALRIMAGVLCIGLLLREYWKAYFAKYFGIYWFVTLLYTLVLMPTIMFVLNNGVFEWLLNSALAVFVLALLVEWQVFVFLLILGISSGYLICSLIEPNLVIASSLQHLYLGIYFFIFAIVIGLTFSRKRDVIIRDSRKQDQLRLEAMEIFGSAIAHDVITSIASIELTVATLKQTIDTKHRKDAKRVISDLLGTCSRVKNDVSIILTNIKQLQANEHCMVDHKCSMIDSIKCALEEYNLNAQERARITLYEDEDLDFAGNTHLIKHVITNLISNALKHAGSSANIDIFVRDNALHFRDNGCGIPEIMLGKNFDKFYSANDHGTGIGLAFCKIAIDKMDGQIVCKSKPGKYTDFIISFNSQISK